VSACGIQESKRTKKQKTQVVVVVVVAAVAAVLTVRTGGLAVADGFRHGVTSLIQMGRDDVVVVDDERFGCLFDDTFVGLSGFVRKTKINEMGGKGFVC